MGWKETGDDTAMIGCGESRGLVLFYFASFVVLSTYVMLNLFIAGICEAFFETVTYTGIPRAMFDEFVREWNELDPDANYMIPFPSLEILIRRVPYPIGLAGTRPKTIDV